VLKKHKAFTATVAATLALGIGATTSMFSVVDGLLLHPLPYPRADRLVRMGSSFGDVRVGSLSAPDASDLAARATTLSAIAWTKPLTLDLAGDGTPERFQASAVSASYFRVLGVAPALGQAFGAELDRPGSAAVAILSHRLWSRRFQSDPAIVGRTLQLNGIPHVVLGVMPAGFLGPDAISQRETAVWIPAGRVELTASPRGDVSWGTIGRLADDADLAAAAAEVGAIGRALALEYPQEDARKFWVSLLVADAVGDTAEPVWLIFGAVSLLWLVACANMANLFLVRAVERTREIAVRAALGAGRGRVARQLLAESALCAAAGGVLGAGLAYVAVAMLRAYGPAGLPGLADLAVDARVLAFTAGLSVVAGLGFGLLPAWQVAGSGPARGFRIAGGSVTSHRPHLRMRQSLVIAQTAMALVLSIGAALLVQSVIRLTGVDPGFDPRDVAWMDVSLPARSYATPASRAAFFDLLLERVRAGSGIVDAGGIVGRPLGGGNAVSSVFPEGEPPSAGTEIPRVPFHAVTPGYFAALRIPKLDGRDFTAADDTTSPRTAVVSRAFAERFWPGQRAVGKRFWMGRVAAGAPLTTIVGVVGDVRQYGLHTPPVPMVYRALAQVPGRSLGLVVRHDGRAAATVLQHLRQAAWSIDPGLPLDQYGTMDNHVRASMSEPRFRAGALSASSATATALACVGLYSTLTWIVRSRRRELGIRLALGADARSIQRFVILRGAKLAGAGLALGAAVAAAVSRSLSSMVFGITTLDAATYATAIAALAVVTLLATWIPARGAAATDPVATLRAE
jgi:putative ABC transport system permease protein